MSQETVRIVFDVLTGPLGAVVFTGAIIIAPIVMLGAFAAYALGLVSLRVRDTGIAAASVLWMLWVVWLTLFYATPLLFGDFSDLPPYSRVLAAGLAFMSLWLLVSPTRIIRRFLSHGSVTKE